VFVISDEEIFSYKHHYQSLNYREVREENSHIGKVLSLLHTLHQKTRVLSIPLLLEEIFASTGMLLTFLTMSKGEQRVANLMKVLELAHSFAKMGIKDFHSFVDWVSGLEETEQEESESYIDEEVKAVRIISIHKAKGLEFPVVFLGDLAGKPRKISDILFHREAKKVSIRLSGRVELKTQDYDSEAEIEKKKLEAEEIRLLYVATTRARDYLFIPTAAREHGYLKLLQAFIESGPHGSVYRLNNPPKPKPSPFLPEVIQSPVANINPVVESWEEQRAKWLDAKNSILQRASIQSHSCASWEKRQESLVGIAVHRVLASLEVPGSDDMFISYDIATLLEEEAVSLGLSSEEKEKARRMLERAVRSPLLLRAARSRRFFQNLPFVVTIEVIVLQGVIDLCFLERQNFFIVSYKTDMVTKENLAAAAASYQREGAILAMAFQKTTQLPVEEVIFFFLQPCISYSFPVTSSFLGDLKLPGD
jgi:ATP-dependent exoDNAse (exonuclease V) beta subunit